MADGTRRSRKEAVQEPLLPGLPDELVLMNVAARIPWETSNVLQMVSRGWLDAIQSRRVYNERLRTQSRLNYLLAMNDDASWSNPVLTVFSTRGDNSVNLRPIPGMKEDLQKYECTVSDGIVYVWGGRERPTCEVYMLDLVGARKWKRCHSILSNVRNQKSQVTGEFPVQINESDGFPDPLPALPDDPLYHIPEMPDSLARLSLPPLANCQWRQLATTDRSKLILTDAQCAPHFPLMRQPMVVQDRSFSLVDHNHHILASHRLSHDAPVDICYPDGLAIQVYYWQSFAVFHDPWNEQLDDDSSDAEIERDFARYRFDMDKMFFIGSELHKLSEFEEDEDRTDADVDGPSTCLWVWDPRAFRFKRGRSCRLQLLRAGEIDSFSVLSCTNVGNVIWAIAGLFEMTVGFLEYKLVRSQELSEGVNEEIIWSDSGHALDLGCAHWSYLRPACL